MMATTHPRCSAPTPALVQCCNPHRATSGSSQGTLHEERRARVLLTCAKVALLQRTCPPCMVAMMPFSWSMMAE